MAESKKINLSKFFKRDSASSSGVGVKDNTGTIPQAQVVMSGRDLSEILNTIENTTEVNTYQNQYIKNDEKSDSMLQSLIDGLQQRIGGLQSSLFNLQSQFEQDLLSRKKLFEKQKAERITKQAEESEKITTVEPKQELLPGEEPFGYSPDSQEPTGNGSSGILNAFVGLGAGVIGAMGGLSSSSGGGSTAGAGVWKPLLDLIASGEGDWESLNPATSLPGATKMTITEVAKKAGDNGDGKNRAVGRYQFTTLRSQAKAAGLDPDKDLFSPENQDKIAVHLLEVKRNGSAWLQGKITDEQFSENLSNEWGALKSATGNVLPGNSGKIGFDKIKPVLQQIKKPSSSASASTAQSNPSSSGQTTVTGETSSAGTATSTIAQEAPPKQPQIEGRTAAVSQAITKPQESAQTANINPIVLPINLSSPPSPSEVEISSGAAIPGGSSRNFTNFYPDLVRSILGVFV
jgi:hypothetical protein